MDNFIYGFYLGASLIIAMGPQNLFVIEQGLKKEHVFLVCLICAFSDFIFIVLGATAFYFLSQSTPNPDNAIKYGINGKGDEICGHTKPSSDHISCYPRSDNGA